MIYILYSGDYEVFLGGNYFPEREVMVDTAEQMLTACEEMGIPLTLFTDLSCLWRYRELGHDEFPRQVDDQMCRALRRGHDVQLHIHPQWSKAIIVHKKDGSTCYEFEPADFTLGGGGGNVYQRTRDVVERGKKYLLDLFRPVDPGYQCVAYRAGAYGIQPRAEAIFTALEDAGFLIDSSIVPDMHFSNKLVCLDFRTAPKKGNYYISWKGDVAHEAERGIFEIPVLAGRLSRIDDRARVMLRRVMRRFVKKETCAPRGYAAGQKWKRPRTPFSRRIQQFLFQAPWRMLDINVAPDEMFDLTRSYIDRYHRPGSDLFFSFSGHPKDVTPDNLEGMQSYHRALKRRYGDSLKAITFQEAARHLADTTAPGNIDGKG